MTVTVKNKDKKVGRGRRERKDEEEATEKRGERRRQQSNRPLVVQREHARAGEMIKKKSAREAQVERKKK